MQVGSLVECIRDNWKYIGSIDYIKFPKRGNLYVVRAIEPGDINKHKQFILLEEITNQLHPNGREFNFDASGFIELQPPMDMELVQDLQWYNDVNDLL